MQANTYRGVIVAAVILLGASGAQAASGTWTSNGSGNWSDTTRWTNAIVADGSGFTAEIGTVNITAHRTVTLDSSRTIGNLRFGDRLTNSHDWILSASGGSVLTLAVASGIPAITVTNRTLTNNVEWAGTQGAGKYGTGTLVINSSNTFAGGFLLNRGQVNVNNRDALGVDTVTVTTSGDATRFVLAGGVNITNALVINANNPSAGNGTIMGPASANTTGTWSGPITVNNTASGGGHFLGGTGVLRLDGSVNAAATVQLSHRAGVLVMAGGGSAPGLTTTGTLLPGANDGLPTNAVLWMGGSAASTLDLNGYNQQLDGLTRNPAQPVLVTNTAGSVSTLTLFTTAPTNVVFNGPIAGNISVVKAWSGTQVLSGTNTYNGDTVVNDGLLDLTGLYVGRGAFTVNGGALSIVLRPDQAFGPVTVNEGGTLALTAPSAVSTLVLPALTNGSAAAVTNTFNLGAGGPVAPVIYATNLAVIGTIYVNLSGLGVAPGRYPLVGYQTASGLTDGSFVANTLPAGALGYISNNTANLSVDLVVTQAPYLVWQGLTNGVDVSTWDIGVTPDWLDSATLLPTAYAEGQLVRFDDSAPGTNLVVPVAVVSPSGVIVSNAIRDYTFAGSAIAGSGRFTKEGAGTVNMAIANTYAGDTVINGGSLRLAAANAIPDGAGAGNTVVEGVLELAGFNEALNGLSGGGTISNNSLGAVSLTIGNNDGVGTFTGDVVGSGVGPLSLTKSGLGTILLAGENRFAGNVTNTGGGTLGLAGPGSPNGAISLGGTLRVLNGLTNSGVFSLTAASVVEVDAGQTGYFSGFTGGVFNLAKTGDGTLLLTNGAASLASFHTEQGTTILDNIAITNTAFDSVGRVAGDEGTLIVRGNAVISITNSDFNVADTANAIGRLFIRDNAYLKLRTFWAGKNATCQGFVYQSGGLVTNSHSAGDWRIAGNGTTAAGTVGGYYMSGGQVDVLANLQIGAYGYGEMIVSGGVVNAWAGVPVVGRYAGSTGRLEVVGGTFYHKNTGNVMLIGEAGTGWLVVSNGGSLVCTNTLTVGHVNAGTGTGTVILGPAGTLVAPGVKELTAAASSTFNFDGGTLQATTTNNALFMQGLDAANVLAGGAVIDSAGLDIGIAQALLDGGGGGGLTKLGAGTLTLSGANTYTGPTAVNQGSLRVTSAQTGGGSVTLADGTTLGVTLAAPGTPFAASALTLGGSGATTQELNLAAYASAGGGVVTAGTLTANGSATLQVGGIIPLGQTRLIDYTTLGGAGFLAFSLAPLPNGIEGELVDNTGATAVDLSVTNLVPLRWAGYNGTAWDINTTINWETNPAPSVGITFTDYSYVRFDDGAYGTYGWSAGPNVVLASNVSPGDLVVSNETGAYVFSGAGAIAGPAGLLKQGAASLTLSNANSYGGVTEINGGTVLVVNASALGSGAGGTVINAGGTLDVNNRDLRSEPVVLRGGTLWNGGGSSQLDVLRQLTVISNSAIGTWTGRFGVAATGTGPEPWVVVNDGVTLTLDSGQVDFRSGMRVTNNGVIAVGSAGYLRLHQVVRSEGGTGVYTVAAGGTLDFGNYTGGQTVISNEVILAGGRQVCSSAGSDQAGPLTVAGTGGVAQASQSYYVTGPLLGPGTLVKIGTNELVLSNTLSGFTGVLSVDTGLVRLVQTQAVTMVPAVTTSVAGVTGSMILDTPGGVTVTGTMYLGLALRLAQGATVPNVPLTIQPGATVGVADLWVGERNGGAGDVWQNGGDVLVSRSYKLGHWPNETSRYVMAGGTLNLTATPTGIVNRTGQPEDIGILYLGVDGACLFTQQAGSASAAGIVFDARGSSVAPHEFTQDGGTFTLGASGIKAGSLDSNANYQVNLGGGTLAASVSWASGLNMDLTGANGPAVFDSAGWAITLYGRLSGLGGLTKAGLGSLTLTTNETFLGNTEIAAGSLVLSGLGDLDSPVIHVATGALFDVSGVSGGTFALASGQTLKGAGTVTGNIQNATGATVAPGSSPGILTLRGDYTEQAGSFLAVEVKGAAAGSGHDVLAVQGAATLAGTLTVDAGAYVATAGVPHVILTASNVAGFFANAPSNGAPITAGGNIFAVYYSPTDVVLKVGGLTDNDGDGLLSDVDPDDNNPNTDGGTMGDYAEWLAYGNATSVYDSFFLSSVGRQTNGTLLVWPAINSRYYRIFSTTNPLLGYGAWTNLVVDLAPNSDGKYTNPATPRLEQYRIDVRLNP